MPFTIQDPAWVNYDVDLYQIQLDRPILLSSLADEMNWENIQFCWKRNSLLTYLVNIIKSNGTVENSCFMDLRYLLNGVSEKFSELNLSSPTTDNVKKRDDFLENFLTSVMIICIREGLKEINNTLRDMDKPQFKLLYSPGVVNLLSIVNKFRQSLEDDGDLNLSDSRLLTESVGSSIGRMVMERAHSLNRMSDKISFLRSHENTNLNVFKLTSVPIGLLDEHHSISDLQTDMMMIQILFDVYKVVSIELHRKVNHTEVHSTDFFYRCPSCVNGFLMTGEYQTMVDSVRECLPLIGRFNGNVNFRCDPLRYEMINDSSQMKFIEGQHLKRGEERFQKLSELGRYGLRLDLVPNSIRKYSGVSSSSIITSKCRSVNNVFNYKSFRLSNFFKLILVIILLLECIQSYNLLTIH